MKGLSQFEVSFSGLKEGKHTFEFPIDKTFFDLFSYELDVEDYSGITTIELDKKSTFMEAMIQSKGKATMICDHSGEAFEDEVQNQMKLLIKFGDEYNNEDDEILILPHGEHQFNAAQYIYENTLFSFPMKRLKPEYRKGGEDDLFIEDKSENDTTDPRWDALKKFKN